MAEKEQPAQGYPLAPSTIMPRSDAEYVATNHQQSQLQTRKKKRAKCLAYIAALAVIQAIIIAVFVLVIVRIRTPRVRLQDVQVANNVAGNNVRLIARVSIRNRNFGRYEFDSSVANIRSGNVNVGSFVIDDARVRARSTRRFHVIQNLSGTNLNSNSSVLDLTVEARLRGKVRTLWVIRRNRTARLNCAMRVNLSTNDVQSLRCE
ncbi:hypothetical protein CASFOL_036795 [Castilleja foliolosa]|uniref:Late embryogenesis abundant protein LEA-2 subgroup domain-containing protein n=1 Tax=Castilleja foliolosa TaxID=1961234 RepID=A0ABD3BRA5_9LAMI